MAFNVAATVTLCWYRNASLFWIMLWLVSGATDHGMIPVGPHASFSARVSSGWGGLLAWYDASTPVRNRHREVGASVYSASAYASEELPDLDVTLRGAVSIARRLQDPLAELVKIDRRWPISA